MGNGDVSQDLVGPHFVVIVDISLRDVVEMPEAETEQVIQALTFKAADPRPRIAIRDGSQVGRRDHAALLASERLVEGFAELGVSIVDE